MLSEIAVFTKEKPPTAPSPLGERVAWSLRIILACLNPGSSGRGISKQTEVQIKTIRPIIRNKQVLLKGNRVETSCGAHPTGTPPEPPQKDIACHSLSVYLNTFAPFPGDMSRVRAPRSTWRSWIAVGPLYLDPGIRG